jgi:hypothetical protein
MKKELHPDYAEATIDKLLVDAGAGTGVAPPEEEGVIEGGGGEEIQKEALAGVQTANLTAILKDVTAGLMEPNAAVSAIQSAYPGIAKSVIEQMVADSAAFTPTPPPGQKVEAP